MNSYSNRLQVWPDTWEKEKIRNHHREVKSSGEEYGLGLEWVCLSLTQPITSPCPGQAALPRWGCLLKCDGDGGGGGGSAHFTSLPEGFSRLPCVQQLALNLYLDVLSEWLFCYYCKPDTRLQVWNLLLPRCVTLRRSPPPGDTSSTQWRPGRHLRTLSALTFYYSNKCWYEPFCRSSEKA